MARFTHKEETEISVDCRNQSDAPVINFTLRNSSDTVSGRKLYILVAVSFGLLCILQAVLNISLRLAQIHEDRRSMMTTQLQLEKGNLTTERDDLKTRYSKLESLNYNLTQIISYLENEKHNLETVNRNLIRERSNKICDNWIDYGSSCYLISTGMKNWYSSKAECEKLGAHLAIISSEDEQRFIGSFNKPLWIGLTDKETEGIWKWVDGTPLTRSYWDINEPNNDDEGLNENCAEIRGHHSKKWNDAQCVIAKFSICEKKKKCC
ncbi:hepatic lectin-like [Thalassophryne amazonica]|uniref:hepatic lectin-like n=1 Tax=Thalassophryne amazonica TaxID=390379 RepID=UPI0014717A13|nr:hepatic lectin-like [Thalassophryne amazonica]